MNNCWTVDKPMASMTPVVLALEGYLVKSCLVAGIQCRTGQSRHGCPRTVDRQHHAAE